MARAGRNRPPRGGDDELVVVNESDSVREVSIGSTTAGAGRTRRLRVESGRIASISLPSIEGSVTVTTDHGETVVLSVVRETVLVVRPASVLVCE